MSNAPEVRPIADVCLIVEGAYPYVQGGVSSWTQDLIATQKHLRFHLLTIASPEADITPKYKLPPNVCGITSVFAGQLADGDDDLSDAPALIGELHRCAGRLMTHGSAQDLKALVRLVAPYRQRLGRKLLLDSPEAFSAFCALYDERCEGASLLNAFWGWRTLVGGLFAAIVTDLPPAQVYHGISTGYAGLFAARAALETGRPAFVTEHGVYTNERRLEILAASWLAVDDSNALTIDGELNKVKELWINAFAGYSRACYQTITHVITLFEGNKPLQVEDGAPPERLQVIPNGVDPAVYDHVVRVPNVRAGGDRPPAIALVGRVVPIKDVKTYIRACALLVKKVPEVVCYVLGPTEEDEAYFAACQALVEQNGLGDNFKFCGMVKLSDYLGKIDVSVLTSISEAQPLVILECGAVGVPTVATDVGACRELVEGRADESPPLGAGGEVVRIGSPAAVAQALATLLLDEPRRQACGAVMRRRVEAHYDKGKLHRRYATLYAELIGRPDQPESDRGATWRE